MPTRIPSSLRQVISTASQSCTSSALKRSFLTSVAIVSYQPAVLLTCSKPLLPGACRRLNSSYSPTNWSLQMKFVASASASSAPSVASCTTSVASSRVGTAIQSPFRADTDEPDYPAGSAVLEPMRTRLQPGVAAGHPATAAAGIEILREGGSAVDAAVAACLASCVGETIMTGLLGGGHAIVFDAADGSVRNLDCFVAVPTGEGEELQELAVPFGEELVHYAIGAASCAVPGVPAGLDALWRAYGRLPWARLCEPALVLARDG